MNVIRKIQRIDSLQFLWYINFIEENESIFQLSKLFVQWKLKTITTPLQFLDNSQLKIKQISLDQLFIVYIQKRLTRIQFQIAQPIIIDAIAAHFSIGT